MSCTGVKEESSNVICRERVSPWPAVPLTDALKSLQKVREIFPIETECLSLTELIHGVVLAEDIWASENIPRTRTSIKDGYAVLSLDEDGDRKVVGVSTAGKPYTREVKSGECVRVSTGGVIPPDCDAVVQVEDTVLLKHDGVEELAIKFTTIPKHGQDIRAIGADVKKGTMLMNSGTELGSAEIGLLAAIGVQCVEVFSKPRICVISTGNELVESYVTKVPDGFIRDSNRPQLLSLFTSLGFQAVDAGVAADEPKTIESKIKEAARYAEVIVTSGGVSMGEKDHLKDVLIKNLKFEVLFGRVWMKPGMPCTVAHGSIEGKNVIVFALPGNPVSSWVCAHIFVLPFVRYFAGYSKPDLTKIKVALGHNVKLDKRPEYCRAALTFASGMPTAFVLGSQLSSRIPSMIQAKVLLELPGATDEQSCLPEGFTVNALVISKF